MEKDQVSPALMELSEVIGVDPGELKSASLPVNLKENWFLELVQSVIEKDGPAIVSFFNGVEDVLVDNGCKMILCGSASRLISNHFVTLGLRDIDFWTLGPNRGLTEKLFGVLRLFGDLAVETELQGPRHSRWTSNFRDKMTKVTFATSPVYDSGVTNELLMMKISFGEREIIDNKFSDFSSYKKILGKLALGSDIDDIHIFLPKDGIKNGGECYGVRIRDLYKQLLSKL